MFTRQCNEILQLLSLMTLRISKNVINCVYDPAHREFKFWRRRKKEGHERDEQEEEGGGGLQSMRRKKLKFCYTSLNILDFKYHLLQNSYFVVD